MSWDKRDYRRPEGKNGSFPFIQWVNSGGSLEPRSEQGGFAMPLTESEKLGVAIPGDSRVLHHRNGGATDIIFTTELAVAVLATRFCWVKGDQVLSDYERGARGKLQALALVRDASGDAAGPVILTFAGLASREFTEARKAHRAVVDEATGGKAPAYAFLGRYAAGDTEMVGQDQKSPITTLVLKDSFDPEAAFVGDVVLDEVDWAVVDDWRGAWSEGGRVYTRAAAKSQAPADDARDVPASEEDIVRIRTLMEGAGYRSRRSQDKALKEKGYEPKGLSAAQAAELISRLEAVQAAPAA